MRTSACVESPQQKNRILAVATLGTMLLILDSGLVSVCITPMMAGLSTNLDEIQWIVTSKLLGTALMIPLTTWLRNLGGAKRVFMASLALYVLTVLLCGLAWTFPVLLLARVLQALAGGALTPVGLSLLAETFSPEERSRALGLWSMGTIFSSAVGPLLGGLIERAFGWPAIFFVQIPLGLTILGLAKTFLPSPIDAVPVAVPNELNTESETPKQALDLAGFLSLSLWLISFFVGLSKANKLGWTSHFVLLCLVTASIAFVWFVLIESQGRKPLVELRLLSNPIFALAICLIAIRAAVFFGAGFILPVFLQNTKGLDAIQTGLVMLPGAVVLALLSPWSGRLMGWLGPRFLVFFGALILSLFFFQYRHLCAYASLAQIAWPTLLESVGLALMLVPMSSVALAHVPPDQMSNASVLLSLIPQIGGSLGVALTSFLLVQRKTYHLGALAVKAGEPWSEYARYFSSFAHRAQDLGLNSHQSAGMARSMIQGFIRSEATVLSFRDAFLMASLAILLLALGSLFLPRRIEGSAPRGLSQRAGPSQAAGYSQGLKKKVFHE